MGVPGLWRLLDMASEPANLENFSGVRIAVDIHSYLNRVLHGNNANNWLFYVMKDLFKVLHFNIRIVIVFMGRKPVQKIYSSILGDESSITSYRRARSALMRMSSTKRNEPPPPQVVAEPIGEFNLPEKRPLIIKRAEIEPYKNPDDPLLFSQSQINRFAKAKINPAPQILHRPPQSTPFIFFEQNNLMRKGPGDDQTKEIELNIPTVQSSEFHSNFLDDVAELIGYDEPSSDGILPNISSRDYDPQRSLPISLLPADNPYLLPVENYVTTDHIRTLTELLDMLNIPYITAPEEASAECARLEMQGYVDCVGSDDNNSFLFGSKWMIRGLFTRPQSITGRSLEKLGLNRERFIMLAMMIDGDYNADIRRRLFTVGPVRGMELIAHFPDPVKGLVQFKEWWIRVVKGGGPETNPDLRVLSRKKWLKRLIVPADFPPADLMKYIMNPVVGSSKITFKEPSIDVKAVSKYITKTTSVNENRIIEYVLAYAKRIQTFPKNKTLNNLIINPVIQSKAMSPWLIMIQKFDKTIDEETANTLKKQADKEYLSSDDSEIDDLFEEIVHMSSKVYRKDLETQEREKEKVEPEPKETPEVKKDSSDSTADVSEISESDDKESEGSYSTSVGSDSIDENDN